MLARLPGITALHKGGKTMNTYIFTVDISGEEYSWRVPSNVTAEDIVRFLSRLDCLNGAGLMRAKTKKDARARLRLHQALHGEDITMDEIEEIEVN